jgi:hypothetical protein
VSDFLLIAVLVAFFALAVGLVQVLGRMIERGTDPDGLADEPPDTPAAADPGAGPGAGPAGRPR